MTGRLPISRVPLLRYPTSPTRYCRGSRVVKFSRNRSTCCFATDRTNSISLIEVADPHELFVGMVFNQRFTLCNTTILFV